MFKKRNNNYDLPLFIIVILFGLSLSLAEFYKAYPAFSVLIFLILLSISFYMIYNNKNKNYEKYINIKTIEDMNKLNWREFEKFIEFIFKQKGYKSKTRKGRSDGGIDVEAILNGQKYLIQCKKWKNWKVGVDKIRDFYGAITAFNKEAKGIYITTSKLTKDANKFAQDNKIEIWDSSNLEGYIKDFKGLIKENNIIEKEKICEKCGGKMIIREAHRGNHKGEHFYGCSNYPKCRNIMK